MGNCAGVDWASEKHDVHVADEAGEELLTATFAHDEAGLGALCRALVRLKVERVAIERPDGVLIERLLDAGLSVIAIHPNQVAAARPRFRACGGKSDRFDAFVLCELARTDHHRFRVLEPDSDETKALRALTRAREDLVHTRVALGHQLRAELERFWPGPIGLFTNLTGPISLAFIERYPSPVDARVLGEQRLPAFLQRERYRGGKTPSELLSKLRRAPHGRAGEAEMNARRAIVLALVTALRQIIAQITELEPADRRSSACTSRRRDLPLVLPLPRLRDLRRDAARRDRRLPCALPNRRRARRRRRPSPDRDRIRQTQDRRVPLALRPSPALRLRHALRHHPPLAPMGAPTTTPARIARGHDHPRAIRTLGRAWCRVIWRCWQDRTPYDPARHGGLQRHITVTIPTTSGPRPDLAATQRMAGAAVTQHGGPQGRARSA